MEFYGFPVGGAAGEMAGYAPAKVKRKDLEEVYDEFSEFSLSSPARKIRRLDAELPPIMEEEEPAAALVFGQPLPREEKLHISSKQLTTYQAFWRGRTNIVKTRDEEAEASSGNGQAAVCSCLAVVPWMPSQLPEPANAVNVSGAKDGLMEDEMATEDADGASMDIEVEGGLANGVSTPGMATSEGLQHWQQHCMTPQVGASESTHVMWSWG